MRGEYGKARRARASVWELPPRARRIHFARQTYGEENGTTSACAENTRGLGPKTVQRWNYLRVRGEYNSGMTLDSIVTELPPRARRILSSTPAWYSPSGTTSACAENTIVLSDTHIGKRNYLRVRGEYITSNPAKKAISELPPRARRIP